MSRKRKLIFLVVVLGIGCNGSNPVQKFDREWNLTLRAGRGELTEEEKVELLKENHPILAQVSDPHASRVLEHFSRLPEDIRQRMLERSFIKWRMSELEPEIQDLYRSLIRVVLEMPRQGGFPSPFEVMTSPEQRAKLLEETEVGFAVVELERSQQRVVSWFAFGPQLVVPIWVTIVNASASRSEEYRQAHIERLPLLRSMRPSTPPKVPFRSTTLTSTV